MKVIHYRYKYRKSWNCSRVCETPREYETWLEHDRKYHEKLERICEYLNNQNDVKSGDVDRWKKSDVYELLFNDAINNFKF